MGILDQVNALLGQIRPDAIGLVDGFGLHDGQLSSTLGRYDGNVYEAIYDDVRHSPLNNDQKMVGWEHLAKVIDFDILREGMKEQRVGEEPRAIDPVSLP